MRSPGGHWTLSTLILILIIIAFIETHSHPGLPFKYHPSASQSGKKKHFLSLLETPLNGFVFRAAAHHSKHVGTAKYVLICYIYQCIVSRAQSLDLRTRNSNDSRNCREPLSKFKHNAFLSIIPSQCSQHTDHPTGLVNQFPNNVIHNCHPVSGWCQQFFIGWQNLFDKDIW